MVLEQLVAVARAALVAVEKIGAAACRQRPQRKAARTHVRTGAHTRARAHTLARARGDQRRARPDARTPRRAHAHESARRNKHAHAAHAYALPTRAANARTRAAARASEDTQRHTATGHAIHGMLSQRAHSLGLHGQNEATRSKDKTVHAKRGQRSGISEKQTR
eukprot:4233490-Pleurochrysis_carterae.AAC.7